MQALKSFKTCLFGVLLVSTRLVVLTLFLIRKNSRSWSSLTRRKSCRKWSRKIESSWNCKRTKEVFFDKVEVRNSRENNRPNWFPHYLWKKWFESRFLFCLFFFFFEVFFLLLLFFRGRLSNSFFFHFRLIFAFFNGFLIFFAHKIKFTRFLPLSCAKIALNVLLAM